MVEQALAWAWVLVQVLQQVLVRPQGRRQQVRLQAQRPQRELVQVPVLPPVLVLAQQRQLPERAWGPQQALRPAWPPLRRCQQRACHPQAWVPQRALGQGRLQALQPSWPWVLPLP